MGSRGGGKEVTWTCGCRPNGAGQPMLLLWGEGAAGLTALQLPMRTLPSGRSAAPREGGTQGAHNTQGPSPPPVLRCGPQACLGPVNVGTEPQRVWPQQKNMPYCCQGACCTGIRPLPPHPPAAPCSPAPWPAPAARPAQPPHRQRPPTTRPGPPPRPRSPSRPRCWCCRCPAVPRPPPRCCSSRCGPPPSVLPAPGPDPRRPATPPWGSPCRCPARRMAVKAWRSAQELPSR